MYHTLIYTRWWNERWGQGQYHFSNQYQDSQNVKLGVGHKMPNKGSKIDKLGVRKIAATKWQQERMLKPILGTDLQFCSRKPFCFYLHDLSKHGYQPAVNSQVQEFAIVVINHVQP